MDYGLHRWNSGKELACQCRRHGFDPWAKKIPRRRKWQPTPIFLPGTFHGQRTLAGYSSWGRKESYTTEGLNHSWPHFIYNLSISLKDCLSSHILPYFTVWGFNTCILGRAQSLTRAFVSFQEAGTWATQTFTKTGTRSGLHF